MRRREMFLGLAAGAALAQVVPAPVQRKGRLKQSVTRGVFGRDMSFEDSLPYFSCSDSGLVRSSLGIFTSTPV